MFVEFINEFGLSQFVDAPTRFTDAGKGHILDLIITNTHDILSDIRVLSPFCTSDHCVIQFQVNNYYPEKEHEICEDEWYYNFRNADYESMEGFLAAVDWLREFSFAFSVDDYWNIFLFWVYRAIELYVPVKKFARKPAVNQYPKYITRMNARKAKLWRKWTKNRNIADKHKYSLYATKCKHAINNYNAARELSMVNCNDLGRFYQFVKSKLSPDRGLPPLRSPDGRLITNSVEKANIFNEYFASVFTSDDNKIPTCNSKANGNMLTEVDFSPAIVYKALRSFKPKCSHGPDGLPSILLRNLSRALSDPLSFIFDSSFRTGVLPSCWRDAIVTPVFKKGATSIPNNYRPISLTCVCCRVMERIIDTDIKNYLQTNKLINTAQHGFLRKHSTNTNLLESVHDWSNALNNKHSIDIIYIDFQKAFDTVSHPKLVLKLKSYGLSGNLLEWIKAFLTHRTQSVKISNCMSDKVCVTSGVPQGSVLGPTLFLMYINDICDAADDLDITIKLFADDVKMYSVLDSSLSADLRTACNRIVSWSENWQMRLAANKCNALRITNKSGHETTCNDCYILNNECLSWCTEVRDLGVLVDNKLSFNKHIDNVVHKAHIRSRLILRSFCSRDCNILMKAFVTYVRPMLEYCSTIWSPFTAANINKIEAVQRNFTKRVSKLSDCSYHDRLYNLKVELLETRRLKCDLITLFKFIHGRFRILSDDFITILDDSTTRGHRYKIRKQYCAVNAFKYNFPNRCIDVWNGLPAAVVNAASHMEFQRLLDKVDLNCYSTSGF